MKKPSHHIRKKYILLILSLAAFSSVYSQGLKEVFSKKELILDTSLSGHSEKWSLNTNKKDISFGPFRTISKHIDKGVDKTTFKDKHNSNWRVVTTKENKTASLSVLHNGKDTSLVRISYTEIKTDHHKSILGGIMLNESRNPDYTERETDFRDIFIQLPNDTTAWHYTPSRIGTNENAGNPLFGILVSSSDTIIIQYAVGFKGLKKAYTDSETGLIFLRNKKQVAAFQFLYQLQNKNYIWMSDIVELQISMLIGAFISVYANFPEYPSTQFTNQQ